MCTVARDPDSCDGDHEAWVAMLNSSFCKNLECTYSSCYDTAKGKESVNEACLVSTIMSLSSGSSFLLPGIVNGVRVQ